MAGTSFGHEHRVRLMMGGDVMLGRGVGQMLLRRGPDYPLGPVAGLMRSADLTMVNLECAITSSDVRWQGESKAFYFGAPPLAIDALTAVGVDMVSLANNHVLDFGAEGLRDTLRLLRLHGIGCAGAGLDIDAARSPAIVDCGPFRFGMAAFCDHQADFAARQGRPGIAYLDLEDRAAASAALRGALTQLRRRKVDWPILSLHWGPNKVTRPSRAFRGLAHGAIDMGWKILFGHSAHVFHGIEMYRGCPIVYAAGDLVDDYWVDPDFNNDQQLLFEMQIAGEEVRAIALHPVVIELAQVRPADPQQAARIARSMAQRCGELGTQVREEAGRIWIDCTSA